MVQKVNKEDYMARIASASPLQLLIITYELTLGFINAAQTEAEDRETREAYIKKAQSGLSQLLHGLDMKYNVAQNLFEIYVYVNKLLNSALYGGNNQPLAEAFDRLNELLTGWRTLEENHVEDQRAVMNGARQVFAGLTYGKDGLDEYVEGSERQGYRA